MVGSLDVPSRQDCQRCRKYLAMVIWQGDLPVVVACTEESV